MLSGPPSEDHPDVPRVRHPHPLEVANLAGVPYLFVPASRLIVRDRTILPVMPMKDSPVDVHLPSQIPL